MKRINYSQFSILNIRNFPKLFPFPNLRNHSNSALSKIGSAFLEIRAGSIEKAIQLFDDVKEDAKQVKQIQLVSSYEQAHCYFLTCHWNNVIPATSTYLNGFYFIYFYYFFH